MTDRPLDSARKCPCDPNECRAGLLGDPLACPQQQRTVETGYVEMGQSKWFTIRWPWASVVFCEFADRTDVEVNDRKRFTLHGPVESRSAYRLGKAALRGHRGVFEALDPTLPGYILARPESNWVGSRHDYIRPERTANPDYVSRGAWFVDDGTQVEFFDSGEAAQRYADLCLADDRAGQATTKKDPMDLVPEAVPWQPIVRCACGHDGRDHILGFDENNPPQCRICNCLRFTADPRYRPAPTTGREADRMTFTRTHTHVTFANPNLRCGRCGETVERFHDPARCGCQGNFQLLPCGHLAEPVSTCPSWGPVDGCRCPGRPHADQVTERTP